jgi:nitrite reductase/ring-hydroxylating ferredoxin subunit
MDGFVKLASLADVAPGQGFEVEHDGRIYAIFNIDGVISAIDGLCPHQGGPLADGEVCGTVVTCPWHGWQFDVQTGRPLYGGRKNQPVFEVKIVGEDILVAVP